MKSLMLFVFLAASAAHAKPDSDTIKALVESQTGGCENFVKFDEENLYMGFYNVIKPQNDIVSGIRVTPFDGKPVFELMTGDSALDITAKGRSLFVLTAASQIQEWDLDSHAKLGTYYASYSDGPFDYKENTEGFARYGDTLIIAHGRKGVTFFDLNTRHVTKEIPLVQNQYPMISMATGVTINKDLAYVVMDNFTLGQYNGKLPFRGVIVIDMKSQTVVKELDGIDPGADAIITDGKTLVISYGGIPIWKYSLATLGGSKMPPFSGTIYKFPIKGHPTALPFMDDKYYYTCFSKPPAYKGENSGSWTNIPLAINRQDMMLN